MGVDLGRVDAQSERQRAEDRQLGAGIIPVEVRRRVGFRVAAALRIADRCVQRAAGRLHLREDRIGRAVQDRDDARDAIAGEPFTNGADNRHRAAHCCFKPELTSLPGGQREQRRPVARDHLLVGGDDGFPRKQGGADPAGGGLDAADGFHHDIRITVQHVVDRRRPEDAIRRP